MTKPQPSSFAPSPVNGDVPSPVRSNLGLEARMTQWLRMLAALAEDLGVFPSTCVVVGNYL